MDSTKFLTGAELEQLYLDDPSSDHLKNQQNLKTLLNHVLQKNMRDLTNSDQEILDFCQSRLYPEEHPGKTKIQFLRDKYTVMTDEMKKRYFCAKMQKFAACFVFMILGGFFIYNATGIESEAGIFDWVKDLFIKEDDSGEQLVISTPDATMEKIEIKEGHLPKKMPEGYVFESSDTSNVVGISEYSYTFKNQSDGKTLIIVKEFENADTLHRLKQEMTHSSSYSSKTNNTSYYYSKNHAQNIISWIANQRIYSLVSTEPFSKLEQILSSY